MALITLQQFKTEAKIEAAIHDTLLQSWITQAEAAIVDICDQPIVATARVYEFYGNGRTTKVHGYHPCTLTSIEYKPAIGEAWTEVDGDAEVGEPEDVPTILATFAFHGGTRYRATLTVGYAADAVPDPVQQAMMIICTERWKKSEIGGKRFGVDSETKSSEYGNITTKFVREMPQAMALLRPYMRRVH